MNVNIIYEDNHLLVVEKPVNIPSQGDDTGDPNMLDLLKQDVKRRHDKPGNVFLGLVHRIDRPVGGVMVFARTSKAASRLSEQIRMRKFNKVYLAVVHGTPENRKDRLIHYLLKDSRTNTVKAVSSTVQGSKEAVLDYEVIGNARNCSLVKVILHTGRPHQIRVQFSEIGHPLYGDHRYGMEETDDEAQIALWSSEITCVHPTREETMTFRSCVPDKAPWSWFLNKQA